MAAAAVPASFGRMNEAKLRQRVDANPGCVDDWDESGDTPLFVAIHPLRSLPLVLWLLDKKGADVNGRLAYGLLPLHVACSLDILNALLDRGADPTLVDNCKQSSLTFYASDGQSDLVARLLQDPRVRATIDVQGGTDGDTALHGACHRGDEALATANVRLLLQSGANPLLINKRRKTPLSLVHDLHPTYTTTTALLEQALVAAELTSLLVKARRLIVAANANVILPYLQGRVVRARTLPPVTLRQLTLQLNLASGISVETEQCRKLCTTLAFLFEMGGGPKGKGMPRDVFWIVMDLLMPIWDPLRRNTGSGSLLA